MRGILVGVCGTLLALAYQNCAEFRSKLDDKLAQSSQSDVSIPMSTPVVGTPLSISVLDSSNFQNGALVVEIKSDKADADPVKVDIETLDDSAKAGINYVATSTSVTIPSNATATTAQIPVILSGVTDLVFKVRIKAISKGTIARVEASILLKASAAPVVLQGMWTQLTAPGAPGVRAGHSAYWTGSKMVVLGGLSAAGSYNTGGMYDPVANTWTATNTTGAPTNGQYHAGVWTGNKVILFGGSGTAVGTASSAGGIFDPATNSWQSLSQAGAPEARFIHTAVWTGTKMIVFGGMNAAGIVINTGGVYDPATDTWKTMTTVGAPSPRRSHTAIWTGTRMIVYGGEFGMSTLNTGASYDPVADTWQSISLAGAPSARSTHTAIWTGSKMVIFGGNSTFASAGNTSATMLNTGGIYDPATDTWASTNTAGAPSARKDHVAVWTGTKMIVTGGDEGGFYVAAPAGAGAFDPATNSWTAFANGPASKSFFAGIWTGKQALFFGGATCTSSGGLACSYYNDVWSLR